MKADKIIILLIFTILMLSGCGGGGGGGGSTLSDTTAPAVSVFTLPSTSVSLTVVISSFTASDNVGVTGYLVTEAASAPSANATGWTSSVPTTFTFSAAGSKTAYAWAKDAAGNVSAVKSSSVVITLPVPNPNITASISTQITGSNAVGTISISGATSPLIYGFEVTVNFPVGATFVSPATAIGVNSGTFIASNPGQGSVYIISGGSSGFGSGDVLSVNFTNVPNTAQTTDFTVTGFIAKDSNGATIQ
jgi:hypothetical protein